LFLSHPDNEQVAFVDAIAPAPIHSATPARATILLVEDDVLVRDVMAEELREAGYTVIVAANAREALEILAAGVPLDAVITDVEMPGGMDGISLARRLVAERPRLVVMLASGVAPHCPLDELPGGFFMKPYRLEILLAHLDARLDERQRALATGVSDNSRRTWPFRSLRI
jgi:CheY-like chemotaxis protein